MTTPTATKPNSPAGPARSDQPRKVKLDSSEAVLRTVSHLGVGLFALICLLPFVLIVSASFSEESLILERGFSLLPQGFSTAAYELIFSAPRQIIGSYVVTIVMTVSGVVIGLAITSM